MERRTVVQASQRQQGDGAVSISYKTLGAIVSVLAILTFFWQSLQHIASQQDISSVRSDMTASIKGVNDRDSVIEDRLRNLELGFARFFGNPATASKFPASDTDVFRSGLYETVQYGQAAPPPMYAQRAQPQAAAAVPRIPVVTKKFVAMFGLQPCQTVGYRVLGDDGNAYCADDILAIMVRIHTGEIKLQGSIR